MSPRVIVIGASAGGMDAVLSIVAQFPASLPASVFVVQHMAPESDAEILLRRLQRFPLKSVLADDGEKFSSSVLYLARPDHHLLVKGTRLLVTKGARENRFRPAIDPLFRSAAVNHGSRVIGVVLTGMLDDGAAGLHDIQRCGGLTVVQDPDTAAYPDMPRAALQAASVDFCRPLGEIATLLTQLINQPPPPEQPIPNDVRTEAEIAERVLSDVQQVGTLGSQVPYNCPNCGGVLWEITTSDGTRFRCHTGHSFTRKTLLVSQSERIEETLWVSLRMFEERKNLLNTLARESGGSLRKGYEERARETEVHIQRVRAMLRSPASEPIT